MTYKSSAAGGGSNGSNGSSGCGLVLTQETEVMISQIPKQMVTYRILSCGIPAFRKMSKEKVVI